MGYPKFAASDFLGVAQAIAATEGPTAVTIGAVTTRLRAPTGSFYHRFSSRESFLGELWLRTVVEFQLGLAAALDAGDGLRAALHTPTWAREHPDGARLLLVYDRRDFVQGEWPEELRDRAVEMTQRMETRELQRARVIFGREGQEEKRLARFVIAEVPVAAVRQHLIRSESPPPIVDRLIRTTYRAVVADYRARNRRQRKPD